MNQSGKKSGRAARRWWAPLLRVVAGVLLFLTLVLLISPCPPWSLKTVIARRAECMNNLKVTLKTVQDRGIPLDAGHSGEVRL